jgi:hypothetical protein
MRARPRHASRFLRTFFIEGTTMSQTTGSSSSFQSQALGDLHHVNNQLFRITLLADALNNEMKKTDSVDSHVVQIVEEIRSAAFDVANSGKQLANMLQQIRPLLPPGSFQKDLNGPSDCECRTHENLSPEVKRRV